MAAADQINQYLSLLFPFLDFLVAVNPNARLANFQVRRRVCARVCHRVGLICFGIALLS